MASPPAPIAIRQNEPSMITLLRAAAVSHRRARRLAIARLTVSILIAGAGLWATLTDTAVAPIATVGALWGFTYSIGLASWEHRELARAALLQEMFDVRVYDIPWNAIAAGERIGAQEVSRLSKRYHGEDGALCDYYEVLDLPFPYDVLACQQQNLGWGARVRRRFADTALLAALAWVTLGAVVGVATNLTVTDLLLRWYVPSFGALLAATDVFRSQRANASERERVLAQVRARVSDTGGDPDDTGTDRRLVLIRQVQDLLFLSRRRVPHVPLWFYERFRADDRADFLAAVDELRDLVRNRSRPATG